mgnify:CR=1 FL=1
MSQSQLLELAEWESYNSPKNKSFVDLDGFKLPFIVLKSDRIVIKFDNGTKSFIYPYNL